MARRFHSRRKFERDYTKGDEQTRQHLYDYGAFPAVRCRCGDELCSGWRRRYQDDWPEGHPYGVAAS